MTPSTLKKLHDTFDDFDDDLDGNIELTMLEKAIRAFGLNPTEEEIIAVNRDISAYDQVNFNQYAYFVYHIARYSNCRDELVSAFKVFDRDGTGKIKQATAIEVLKNCNQPFEEQQIKRLFSQLEVDNGFIDYNILVDILLND
ncbi:EF hand family protein [Trichomonas vaginalis G3]|uniref:EF hand family protein n=1 Tax=Trichomonas vaginalis (strain ATCC PRA-98 / G3) TaxID=412133 RepID=A2E466_TRIV3|nr:calcium-binding protein family [Trichomonas vaginalis G3]EAY12512.1 EF hand family protein [Trichomonas vaginalis G3]KAI5554049.1 calcium-binding protein family [Trichomonas vaginalis G3]|eukprot:XP_001324735.1 EF hand family protein [Trichomonas vaginalis G3]